ncbi:hypothetical protein Pfo_015517 [Paulownia fortunei]|nr:hypothetical protein Pfo_015517 [Paulownia fortunei]
MNIVSVYGPRDTTSVFAGAVDRTLTVRQAGAPFWSLHGGEGALHPRVVHMLYDMGFYGVHRCGHFDMDFHLITALVERWRPETHTFYFRIGEVTVTLQDVAPVIEIDPRRSTEQWQDYCHHYLGFRPTSQQFRGGRILLSALRGYLEANPVTDDTPHDELERYARGCALILLGSIMCPDSSGNGVSLLYLQSMEQIKDVVYFSWGSAVLSFMYRELCNASDKDKNVIGGAMVLLQWANRHQFIIVNPPITGSDSTEPRYIDWYDGITRRLISSSHLPMEEGVADEAGPSTSTHRVSHGLDSTADYYVPQQAQPDDSFTPYWGMPPSTMSFSTLLTSDLDMAQKPFVQQHIGYDSGRGDFTVSPIVFPHLDSDYHDRGESTSITLSDQSHDIAATQGERRGRRQRQRRTCGTGGHF